MYHHFLFLLQNLLFRLTQTSAVYYPLLPAETEDFRSLIPVYGKNSNPVRVYRFRNCSTSRSDRCCRYSYSVLPGRPGFTVISGRTCILALLEMKIPRFGNNFLFRIVLRLLSGGHFLYSRSGTGLRRGICGLRIYSSFRTGIFRNTGFGFFGTILFRFRNSFSLRYIFMNSLPVMVSFSIRYSAILSITERLPLSSSSAFS